MPDFSRSLISKIVQSGDILPTLSAGIKRTWFDDTEHQEVFGWVVDYFTRYGEAPTKTALRSEFPTYRLTRAEEPYEFYLDHFRKQRRRSIIVDSLIESQEHLDTNDTQSAEAAISRGLIRLGVETSSLDDSDGTSHRADRYRDYRTAKNNVGLVTGVPSGFPALDFVSGGFHPEQFIIFGGTPKMGKSFLLMKSAVAAQLSGRKVLFVSFEMSVKEQMCRYDGIHCGVNAQHLLKGTITVPEIQKLKKGLRMMRHLPPFIISADISASTTISGLAAKVEEHQPDVIFVDGVYLMENEIGAPPQTPQAFTAISRGLKRLAQRTKKPLVATTQALSSKMGREQIVTLHSLGWTSAWSQDADVVLGVERVEDTSLIKLRVVAGRNVSPRVITVACNWDESLMEEADVEDEEDEAE